MCASRISLLVVCLGLGACDSSPSGNGAEQLVVSAAVSVSDALRTVADAYTPVRGVDVLLNVAGSDTLSTQLINGARADLFLSADYRQMDRAEEAGRILTSTRVDLLSNQLVAVVPTDRAHTASGIDDLLQAPWVRYVAMGDPDAVPAGVYARRYLRRVGLWDAVQSKVVPTRDVRAALAAVEAGNADVGLIYRTDLAVDTMVRVAFSVPVHEGPRIRYPVALVADGRNEAAAQRFLSFLRRSEARRIFEEAGFILMGEAS